VKTLGQFGPDDIFQALTLIIAYQKVQSTLITTLEKWSAQFSLATDESGTGAKSIRFEGPPTSNESLFPLM
jgi:hypothetical protein